MLRLPKASIDRSATPTSPSECAGALLDGLPQVVWFIRRHMRSNRGRALTVPQFRTLVLLSKCPNASLSDVADHLGTTLPSVSRMVAGLTSRGWVAREKAAGDSRRWSLVCTRRGEATLADAEAQTRRRLADELGKLTGAERDTIAQAVALLRRSFAAVLPPGGEPKRESTPSSDDFGKRRPAGAQPQKHGKAL